MTSLAIKDIRNNAAIIPVVVTIVCLVPFVGKAFHMDDTLFIWSAKQIQKNPTDFYGFEVNWDGTEKPIAEVTKNPPAASYYIALVGALVGWSELALHIAFLVPAVAAALGVYYLAKEFCSLPVIAALAAVLTPGFLVSSTNIMCDTMMLAFWVWAVFFWMRGIKENKRLKLLFAAVLIAVCALTKYFGIVLVGLLFVYSLVQRRRPGVWVLFLLIPVVVLAGYQWVTYSLYGRGLLLDATSYATGHRHLVNAALFSSVLVGLAFTGGCLITGLFYVPLLWSRRVAAVGILLVILLVISIAFAGRINRFFLYDYAGLKWGFLIQLGLMVLGGVSVLGLAGVDFWKCKDADSLLLLLWVAGTFIFASFINWVVNTRSILPMVPAAGILLIRRIESRNRAGRQGWSWRLVWPLIPSMIVSLLVCRTDYVWAGTARSAASAIHKEYKNSDGTVWFQGHWGFQNYMEANGYQALDYKHSKLIRGDIIIAPSNQSYLKVLPMEEVSVGSLFKFTQYRWLATMNSELGAGFYAATWGPLPFAIGPVTPERYYVLVVN